MTEMSDLEDSELAWLLQMLEKHPADNDEVKRMVHDLFMHRVELEQQNRELRAMQEKLEESRDLYASLYDFAPVANVTVDATGSIQEINLAGAELLGKERQNLIGTNLAGFAEPGNRRSVLSFLRRLSDSDGLYTEIFSLTSADGRKSIVRAQGHGERTARPRYIALVEVTASQQPEQALAQSEDNHRPFEDQPIDLISCHDAAGKYIYVSPSCRKILGYKSEELSGRSVFEVFHPNDLDKIHVSYATALSPNPTSMLRCRIRHKEGDYAWFQIKCQGVVAGTKDGKDVVILEYRKTSNSERFET